MQLVEKDIELYLYDLSQRWQLSLQCAQNKLATKNKKLYLIKINIFLAQNILLFI